MLTVPRPLRWLRAPALRRLLDARRRLSDHEAEVGGLRIRSRHGARRAPRHDGPDSPDRTVRPPIVLLAGLGLSGRYLLPLAHRLAATDEVWVPDLPGFGRSERPCRVLDVGELAEALIAWMDAVGIARAVLVGNSAGCQIAVEAAARHPDRVAAVVLEAPTIDAYARSVVRQLGRVSVDAFQEPFSLWGLQLFDWMSTGPRRLIATTRHVFGHALEARCPLVRCPALVMRGSRDPIVPQRWAEAVAGALPLGTLHVDVGGTHAMPYSAPERLAASISAFLAAREVPSTSGGAQRTAGVTDPSD